MASGPSCAKMISPRNALDSVSSQANTPRAAVCIQRPELERNDAAKMRWKAGSDRALRALLV